MKAMSWVGIVILSCTAGASAAGLLVLDKTIEAMPGQEVLLLATGVGPIGGVDLWVQVGDGGSLAGGTNVPGVDAGRITNVAFPPSGWLNPVVDVGSYNGLLAHASAVTATPRPVPEFVATLILDGTGLTPGQQFTVALEIPSLGQRSDFAGEPADPLVSGVITVVPEPVGLLMLLPALWFVKRGRALRD